MGAVSGLFGLGGGAAGTSFAAPKMANIESGTDVNEIGAAGAKSDAALRQQQYLLNALQQQGGIQNQSNVYNQLQGIASGTGPNPAQAMLNQQTGNNVAQQAALMAGQRGAGANVGLMARQAGQQGGALQQQAVGQGATLQANQSLNAIGQAGNMANTQAANQIGATGAVTSANQAQQANLLNALGAKNTAAVASQNNVNTANAGLAESQMQGTQKGIGGLFSSLGGAGSLLGGGKGGGGGGGGGGEGMGSSSNSPYAPGASEPGPYEPQAHGGLIKGYDNGGAVSANQIAPPPQPPQGPQSSFGQFLSQVNNPAPVAETPPPPPPESSSSGGGGGGAGGLLGALGLVYGAGKGIGDFFGKTSNSTYTGTGGVGPGGGDNSGGGEGLGSGPSLGGGGGGGTGASSGPPSGGDTKFAPPPDLPGYFPGGMVPVMVSPGEKIVAPEKVTKAAGGKVEARTVPGKAKVKGDNQKNDIVSTSLPAGSIVVPRTHSHSPGSAAAFVRMTLAKRGRK